MGEKLLSGKTVLITGGTGSFGRKFTEGVLAEGAPKRLIIFSLDEFKQHEMRVAGLDHPSLRYFIGDVRDLRRLQRAMQDVDLVIHAAALKQVPACEYNPIEAVATNVNGASNVIEAALDCGVKSVVALSTDKAVDPVNLYGATKLVAEKLFVQANSYAGAGPTRFSCVRYGNVIGSRGSVIEKFIQIAGKGPLPVTDARMTRFWLTLDQGVRFVLRCYSLMCGGEVFVPKIPSMNIMDLATAISTGSGVEETGIRPGEKLHEVLISEHEARHTVQLQDMFVVQPAHPWWLQENWVKGEPVQPGFSYKSDENTQWLTDDELRAMVSGLTAGEQ